MFQEELSLRSGLGSSGLRVDGNFDIQKLL